LFLALISEFSLATFDEDFNRSAFDRRSKRAPNVRDDLVVVPESRVSERVENALDIVVRVSDSSLRVDDDSNETERPSVRHPYSANSDSGVLAEKLVSWI
jgi:hypothetical protein